MIITELYNGQGLGNQLWCYVVTRVIAEDKSYDFGIMSPEKFKASRFMKLDFGKPVKDGTGPEGGPPLTLPEEITHYYAEKKISRPDGTDVRVYDPNLMNIADNTKIDGIMQDEHYILHRRNEILRWLHVEPVEFTDDECVINFRGREYTGNSDVFLPKKYWTDAIAHMRTINPHFRFIVITDDALTAHAFFPNFPVYHDKNIEGDYRSINNAKYLILSNSSFAWFPAWLNTKLKFCIAPKYWARYNVSDGYWACGYNITKSWMYQDREGKLSDYDTCIRELAEYNRRQLPRS
jgi:hypothetical protein